MAIVTEQLTTERPARLIETHVSTLVFVGDRVYKIKKPIKTHFLDWTSVGKRREACSREVYLNRRLCPDVYLGVATLEGPLDGENEPVVVMRRLPHERALSELIRQGADVDGPLRALGRQLADFHAGCAHDGRIASAGTPDAVAALWADTLNDLQDYAEAGLLRTDELAAVTRLGQAYMSGRSALFSQRVRTGRIRDGHGDLLADDIFVLDDGVRILDCLEFDERLRHGDVLADVAFLAMDLQRMNAPRAARSLLDAYREFSGDTWPPSLAAFWIGYRALVRSKVACLGHLEGGLGSLSEAHRLLDIARGNLEQAEVRLVLMGGFPGTGKSTLASGLADELGWVQLSSDELREQLFGRSDPPAPYRHGKYQPEGRAQVYDLLLREAGECLAHGQSVVLDATWLDPVWRHAARQLGRRHQARVIELRCDASAAQCSHRIRSRTVGGSGSSEVTAEVAAMMRRDAQPWPEARLISTSHSVQDSLLHALDQVAPGWFDGLMVAAS